MLDPLSLAAGAAVASALVLGGSAAERLGSRNRTPKPVETLCSCEHGYDAHEAGGRCRSEMERPHYWSNGDRNGYEWVPCACLAYDGPEPLPRVWTP